MDGKNLFNFGKNKSERSNMKKIKYSFLILLLSISYCDPEAKLNWAAAAAKLVGMLDDVTPACDRSGCFCWACPACVCWAAAAAAALLGSYFRGLPLDRWRLFINSASSTIQKEPKSSSYLTKHLCSDKLVRIAFYFFGACFVLRSGCFFLSVCFRKIQSFWDSRRRRKMAILWCVFFWWF